METQPQLPQEVTEQTTMDETQQSLLECVKVKIESHDETKITISSRTEGVSISNLDLLRKSVSRSFLDNQQLKNDLPMNSEDMIEVGEVKVETKEVDDGKPFKCNICPKTYSLSRTLKKHVRNCHGPKIHDCDLCDTSFRTPRDLVLHKERHEREKEAGFYSVQAQLKAKAANSKNGIDETNTDHAAEQNSSTSELQCAKCFTFWPNQNRLWLHYQSVHKEKLQCCLCNQTFYYEVRLIRHMLLMHKQKDGSFKQLQCTECKMHFETQRLLTRHKQKHRPKNHKCVVCNQAFILRSQLETHKQSHRFDGFIWECQVCNKSFPSRKLRSTHMRIHEPKEHKCPICSKECRLRTNLLTHLRTHEGENFTLIKNSPSSSLPEAGENSESSVRGSDSPHIVEHKQLNVEAKSHEEFDHKTETEKQLNLKQERVSPSRDLWSNNEETLMEEDDKLTQDMIDIGEVKIEPRSDDELDKPTSTEMDTFSMNTIGAAENSGVYSFKCNACGKVMPSRLKWWYHNRKVHGPRKFECHICGKPCFDKHTLRMHVPSHDKIKKRKRSKPSTKTKKD